MGTNKWTFKDSWLPKCPPIPPSLFVDNSLGDCMVKQLGVLGVLDMWQKVSPWKLIGTMELRWPATRLLPPGRNLLTQLKCLLLTWFCWIPLMHVVLHPTVAALSWTVQNGYLNPHIKRFPHKGWGEEIVREFGRAMYTLLCLKWKTNKDLLDSTQNSAKCYMAAWMGGHSGGEWFCVCVWLSPFAATWNYHNTANQLCSNTKLKV